MRQRIFIAINLPQDIRNKLLELQEKIKKEFESLGGTGSQRIIRFAGPENLHLTLLFLGYISAGQMEALKEALEEIGQTHKSFDIMLKSAEYAPPGINPPRMIWAEIEKSKELAFLRKDLLEAAINKPEFKYFSPEKRPFTPHLTLARLGLFRLKEIGAEELPEVKQELKMGFRANSLEIMQSVLKRTGAEYEIIFRAELKS